jgi:inner membrane protein
MTAKNHFLFSIAAVSLTLGTIDPFVLLLAGAMSLLPDIDSSKSVIGKIFFPLSKLIERHFPHRTFTHSFFMTAILAIGAIPLAFEGTEFYFATLSVFSAAGFSTYSLKRAFLLFIRCRWRGSSFPQIPRCGFRRAVKTNGFSR